MAKAVAKAAKPKKAKKASKASKAKTAKSAKTANTARKPSKTPKTLKQAKPKPKRLAFETVEQTVFFSAPPEVIYRAWLDSRQHAEFTGGAAKVDPKVGGAFTTLDHHVRGKTLELVPNERIVQSWKAADFPAGYPASRLELTLVPESGGTKLCLVHQSLPKQRAKQYDEAWKERYWRPLRAYLAQREA